MGASPAELTQIFKMESSPDLSLLLFLGNCSIKGLAGGRTLVQSKAWGVRHSQGRIGGLNGQRLPHLHWLSLHSNQWGAFSLGLFGCNNFAQRHAAACWCWLPPVLVCLFAEAQQALADDNMPCTQFFKCCCIWCKIVRLASKTWLPRG